MEATLVDEESAASTEGLGIKMSFTDNAIEKVKDFAEVDNITDKHLRVYVEGGGCSGFAYRFAFDEQKEGDEILELSGIKVLVDPASGMYLDGSQVDFVEDFRGAGFTVTNPSESGRCGCGSSFSM